MRKTEVHLQVSFRGAPTHADTNFLWQLKNQGSGRKTEWLLYYFYSERNYDVLKSKSSCFLLNKNITLNKRRQNRNWKICVTLLGRWTMCFSSYKNYELKLKLWWVGARERKKSASFVTFILSKRNLLTFVFYVND